MEALAFNIVEACTQFGKKMKTSMKTRSWESNTKGELLCTEGTAKIDE